MAKTSQEKIDKMVQLYNEGYSVRAIAEMVKMGNTTVRDNIKMLQLERPFDLPPKYYPTVRQRKRIMDMCIRAKAEWEAKKAKEECYILKVSHDKY